MTQGYQLDQTLPLRLIKSVDDNDPLEHNNVLLEYGGLPTALRSSSCCPPGMTWIVCNALLMHMVQWG